ncbi:hypothetical protein N0V82_002048 [Gnomoniopsis sp. IMI 355080]|nr:hypothetical protein N0V82_002048 [Gnomoniopsis sp. IMI 355080]
MSAIPDFDDLPKVEGMPQGCAWGIFDKDGKKDLLGTLNLLTPAVVAAAATEVKDGVSISLNWPLNGSKLPPSLPSRPPPTHKVIPLMDNGLVWDDTLEFNTQISSQWDSLVHVQHMPSGLAYNGLQVTQGALTASQTTAENTLPTLDHWHTRGGLVGRGVLIDFKAYMDDVHEAKQPPYHAFDGYRITVEEVEAVAKHQGVEFRHGDILIIRTGATEVMENPTPHDFSKLQHAKLSGIHGTEDTARWVWNKHFSAVASDSPGFEAFPPLRPDGTEGSMSELGRDLTVGLG